MAKGPEPSCSSSPGSIVSASSRDSSGGSSPGSGQSRYKAKKDKHHRSKCYSQSPSSRSESEFESVSQGWKYFLPMGQGPVEIMSETPDCLTSREWQRSLEGLVYQV